MGPILIKCDLGEHEADERTERLLELVDAANICCGVHAGSEAKTRWTIELAAGRNLLIGAHPGLPAEGGRGEALPEPHALRALLDEQVERLLAMAGPLGLRVQYVKLHGSLYHAVERNETYADAYLAWLKARKDRPGVFALAGGAFAPKAEAAGLKVWREAFADRGYWSSGTLVPRGEEGAVLDAENALARFEKWLRRGLMDTVEGGAIALKADTVCVHSDSPDAETLLAGLRNLTGG